MVASYVTWRADQVLYGSYTLDIDSDDVGSLQDRALGGEAVTSSKVRLQNLRTLCMVRGFPVVASFDDIT